MKRRRLLLGILLASIFVTSCATKPNTPTEATSPLVQNEVLWQRGRLLLQHYESANTAKTNWGRFVWMRDHSTYASLATTTRQHLLLLNPLGQAVLYLHEQSSTAKEQKEADEIPEALFAQLQISPQEVRNQYAWRTLAKHYEIPYTMETVWQAMTGALPAPLIHQGNLWQWQRKMQGSLMQLSLTAMPENSPTEKNTPVFALRLYLEAQPVQQP